MRISQVALGACLLHLASCVKVKMVMHSDEDNSRMDDEEPHTEAWEHKKKATASPFKIRSNFDEDRPVTDKALKALHPNDMFFPLVFKQAHINNMFKFGDNWYTWTTDKRSDGTAALVYYVCYEEPKHCDDVGWEHIEAPPKCAVQIDSLTSDDRACLSPFGVEAHYCETADQMKVSDLVHTCGSRIRSLWRFVRSARRPAAAQKPADINSLVCEDEDECFVSVEYRIHRDRITFSLHEPARGQTFKSALKRDLAPEDEVKTTERPKERFHLRAKKNEEEPRSKKAHIRAKSRNAEGKGVVKERNDSGYRRTKNKIKIREDVSYDQSE
ncbi:unnamed protein product [Plutella xylostella]|uniref:(diamondback moth) hypothetical protein n=1 Tax=Plutella xylostella TaxID=51655 RepID=A0A8S4GDP3_PLUXY|nr:unnamed protein product [Plutella xylostella]